MARSPYEIQAQKELEAEGYQVDYKIRPPTFCPRGYQVDYFGVFDLIAYKKGEAQLRWISIKGVSSGSLYKNKKDVENFTLPEGNRKEIWHIGKNKEWIKNLYL